MANNKRKRVAISRRNGRKRRHRRDELLTNSMQAPAGLAAVQRTAAGFDSSSLTPETLLSLQHTVGNRRTAGLLSGRGGLVQRTPAGSKVARVERRPVQATAGPLVQRNKDDFDKAKPGAMGFSDDHIEAKQTLKRTLQEMSRRVDSMAYLRQKSDLVNKKLSFTDKLGYSELVLVRPLIKEVLGKITAFSDFTKAFEAAVATSPATTLSKEGLKKLGLEIAFDLYGHLKTAKKEMNQEAAEKFEALTMEPIDDKGKEELAEWLRNIPAIKRLLAFHKQRRKKGLGRWLKKKLDPAAYWRDRHEQLAKQAGGETAWADGESLADESIIEWDKDDETAGKAPIPKDVMRRLKEADSILKLLVEPEVLAKIDRPKVVLCKDQSRSDSHGNRIELGLKHFDTTDITHETGHHIERNTPGQLLIELDKLRHVRHAEDVAKMPPAEQAEKKDKLEYLETRTGSDIGRYRGEYPVTGRYTSRQSAGSTEVASMTIEYLGDPKKARQMIAKDPVQAAVVLRQLMPKAFQTLPDNLKGYLPHER